MNFKELNEKYPLVYPVLPVCGIWVPKGWEKMIHMLSAAIQNHLLLLKEKNMPLDFKVEQIKEKFGGLRFYYSGGDDMIEGMVRVAEIFSYEIPYSYE